MTAKAKTVLFIALGVSDASLQFVVRVVSVGKSGVQWEQDSDEVEVVYFGRFASLACIPCVRLVAGKYLFEAAFVNDKPDRNEVKWNLLVNPSCSPGSLEIQPDKSKHELAKARQFQYLILTLHVIVFRNLLDSGWRIKEV